MDQISVRFSFFKPEEKEEVVVVLGKKYYPDLYNKFLELTKARAKEALDLGYSYMPMVAIGSNSEFDFYCRIAEAVYIHDDIDSSSTPLRSYANSIVFRLIESAKNFQEKINVRKQLSILEKEAIEIKMEMPNVCH